MLYKIDRNVANFAVHSYKMLLKLAILLLVVDGLKTADGRVITRRSFADQSVKGYLTERTCWWNEVCKEEFQNLFRCKCPAWSFCRAPGRYYNAYCSMTATGYIWSQPGLEEI
ncbi:PREDICTED: uncharacterized protein LOC108559519 [Nicrophorus vespilloides]|uniref:Uncharacterized protein LOC108559519 n=1 Tax=Nicrophorus vespilloides TaxID=110193 RepID=A0ABM1MCL1_NICVS|nr:PREDICTED: uncharacterized protein LOC108559519 [Nicrophorus vespilloides]